MFNAIALTLLGAICISAQGMYTAPELIVYSRDDVIEQTENTLICFINHFFPPIIKTKWTKNGIEVETEDSFKAFILNPDGTFHLFSTLSFNAKDGDIYGCTVEHEALTEPKTEFFGENT
uniref:Ig-like domain-containing protein n=1 Tax=Sphaeramia orbicularis TaxID=375764 RepID=A0A672Z722_9TELE